MTTKYEFAGSLYRGENAMLDAIAETWLSANGANSAEDQCITLATMTNAELAQECMDGWCLDRDDIYDDDEQSHMALNEYDFVALVQAFRRLRIRKSEEG